MKLRFLQCLLLASVFSFYQCSSSDSGDSDDPGDDADSLITSSGASAISGLFGGSEESSLIKNQEFESNCDEPDNSVEPVLIVQDGIYGDSDTSLAGTHGSEEIAVTADDFCANGGEWSGFVLVDPVEFDCGLFMVGGQGIWQADADHNTTVHGTFVMSTTEDGAGTTFTCSGDISGTEGLNCVDDTGAEATLGETESCLPVE